MMRNNITGILKSHRSLLVEVNDETLMVAVIHTRPLFLAVEVTKEKHRENCYLPDFSAV